MKKLFFFLLFCTFAFACSKEPAHTEKAMQAADRSAVVQWHIQDAPTVVGATVEAKFTVTGFTDLTAFQYAMQFDTSKLAYSHTTFTGAVPGFNLDCCFGMQELGYFVEPGEVRIAWVHYAPGGKTLATETNCFSMFFTAKTGGILSSAFVFNPDNYILPPEASDSQFNILPLTVSYLPIPLPAGTAGNQKRKKHKNG